MKYQDLTLLATELGTHRDNAGTLLTTFKLNVPHVLPEPETSAFDRKALRELQKAATAAEARWEDALALGIFLADILLPDAVRRVIAERRTQAKALGQGLRLRLALPAELQRLPWEFLALNQAGGESTAHDFLVLDPHLSLVRQPAVLSPVWETQPEKLDTLTMLVALAGPEDQPPLDLAKERATLEKLLAPINHVKPEWVMHATPQALLEGSARAHLFHFAGHGEFLKPPVTADPGKAEGKGVLVLENEMNESIHLDGDRLGVALRARGARVAVLGACHSAERDDLRQWSGIAEALLKAELGAVVGMQFAVRDDSAIAFTGKLYQALLAGMTMDEAVHAGRAMLAAGMQDVRGFATPVLYLRSADGVVFPELAVLPGTAAQQAQIAQAAKADDQTVGGVRIGKIDLRYSKGAIIGNTGTVNQHFGDNINTGGGDYIKGDQRNVNTGGGAYIEGNINVQGDFVGRDKIINNDRGAKRTSGDGNAIGDGAQANTTKGISGSSLHAQTINVFVGDDRQAPAAAKRVHERIRLDVACPSAVIVNTEFDVAVSVRQPNSPRMTVADLDNLHSSEGHIQRESHAEVAKYRVEISSADFAALPPKLTFNLVYGHDSSVKWFKVSARRAGKLSFLVIAYQVDEEVEVASTRVVLQCEVETKPSPSLIARKETQAEAPSQAQALVALLNEYFSLSEIEGLCFELGLDDEQLEGETKDEMARSLVKQVSRLERVEELKRLMRIARPNLRTKLQ